MTITRLCAAEGDTGLGRDIGESASSTLNCVLNQPKKDFLPALDRWVARAEEDFWVVGLKIEECRNKASKIPTPSHSLLFHK